MIQSLSAKLATLDSFSEKISVLENFSVVAHFLRTRPTFHALIKTLSHDAKCALLQTIAIGQGEILFPHDDVPRAVLESLSRSLIQIDEFYREIGGIVGYQTKILHLLQTTQEDIRDASYHSPFFFDITEEKHIDEAISWGLSAMPTIAEIYPLGGAADRLHLVEEESGLELPAAKLPFAGYLLLEHLVRDLQAREYLYYQTHGVQLTTPIAMMTSHEKNNHAHVQQICEQSHYFHRPKDSIRLFTQPLVPAVSASGNWCMQGPFKPLLKPGGHGAIWKLARDSGIFAWLSKQNRKKLLVRQINNPIAGLDYGLLAFSGIGWKHEMIFGFASCPRLLKAAEGVNVLVERGSSLVLTNIEYCDFAKFGIEDQPLKNGEPYSRFSSNTNILFADLNAISNAVDRMPFPGLLINLKKASYTLESGEKKEETIARLESTMQNIADVFVEEKQDSLRTQKTFVTYNSRHKTISTVKKAFLATGPLQETPENCLYDLLFAHRELLASCDITLPPRRTLEEYLQKGPEFLLRYHPALGPLYSIIRKKLHKGNLSTGSELLLEITQLNIHKLQLKGSLQILAEQPMGHFEDNILCYSDQVGRCTLENVTIENRGVDWTSSQPFWKKELKRFESVKIILKGKSSFYAKNITLKGSQTFIVEDGQTLTL